MFNENRLQFRDNISQKTTSLIFNSNLQGNSQVKNILDAILTGTYCIQCTNKCTWEKLVFIPHMKFLAC